MAHMTSTVPFGESSWGATLQQYQKDRLTVPEATAKPVERQRPIDTYNQNKPVARTFNPVLMKFTNPAEERARVDKDHNSSMHRMNVAKDKQLVYEQTFNIVSHKSHLKGPQTTQSEKLREATRLPDSRVNYNILSHHDRSKHMGTEGNSVSIIPPPRSPRADHPNVHPAISSFGEELPRSHDIGDFNIISNRYHQGHEVREKNDLRKLKVEAQTRYWQTHNYDPVVGRYYDIEKEDEYHKQKDALETVQGSCQVARLPPSIQYSEGSGYNILSHSVKDEQKLALASGVGNRAMKSKKGPVIEAEIRERAEELDRLVETRTMARISNTAPAREREQGRHHGYDMITNEPWQGRNNKPIADSRLKAPNTVWAKLHSERDAAPMGTSIKVAAKPARDLSGAAPQNPASPSSYQTMTATAAARTTARQSLSARGATAGSGRGGSSAPGAVRDIRPPTVPALRMPSNITALQNNYDVAPASAKPTPKPTPPPMPQSSSRPGVRTGGFN